MQLLCPEWLLSMDNSVNALKDHAVLIDGTLIAAVGLQSDLKQQYPNATKIILNNQVLMPGLINCHTHAGMTLLRGAADDMPLQDWLQKRIWPLEGKLADAEFVYDSTILACAEMIRGGTTFFNDMYFFPEAVAQASTPLTFTLTADGGAAAGWVRAADGEAVMASPAPRRRLRVRTHRHGDVLVGTGLGALGALGATALVVVGLLDGEGAVGVECRPPAAVLLEAVVSAAEQQPVVG